MKKSILFAGLVALAGQTFAQGTAFTYQGRLNDTNGPLTGVVDLEFRIFDAASGGTDLSDPPVLLEDVAITNGLFTALLNFEGVFTGGDRFLEIGVRPGTSIGAYTQLTPRQPVTPSPYAIRAGAVQGLRYQPGNQSLSVGTSAEAMGSGALAAGADTLAGGDYSVALGQSTVATGTGAMTMGQNTTASGERSFAGGTRAKAQHDGTFVWADNQPADFASTSSNQFLIRASRGVGINTNNPQAALHVVGAYARVDGGNNELAYLGGDGDGFDVQVGSFNTNIGAVALWNAGNLSYMNLFAKGGTFSGPVSIEGSIRGGYAGNSISNGILGGFLGGGGAAGFPNEVSGNYGSVVGGLGNSARSDFSTVSGGRINTATAFEATVAGGGFNSALGFASTVGGGGANTANGGWATIAGGRDNQVTNADYATIGGGQVNRIGTNSIGATIAGGEGNSVRSNSWRSTIAGGYFNSVGAPEGTVAGGAFNSALGFSSTVSGGGANSASGGWATIAGGRDNVVTNSDYATIGGGAGNLIAPDSHFATIPGGRYNSATSYAFAAGNRAKANHVGTFVWSDTVDADFPSAGANQFLIRAGGGVGINTNNPGNFALAVRGNTKVDGSFTGGFVGNVISNGVVGGFIGGGGSSGFENRVGGNFGAIAGGVGNVASGSSSFVAGESSRASGRGSIALGWNNVSSSEGSVALGFNTIASGLSSTAMGYLTRATNDNATAMGQGSLAGGWDSVAMGTFTVAAANYTTAAGYYAQANHPGSFVWADSTSVTPFATTAANQFLIRANGGVGINTTAPQAPLHVWGRAIVNGSDFWDVNNTEGDFRVGSATHRFKIGVAQSGGGAGDVWMRAHGGTARLFVKTPGGTTFYSNEGQTTGVNLAAGGGSFTSLSDRNAKENFQPVNALEVLEKVAVLPLSTWNYKSQDASIQHLGPMAQDFKAAFGLGESETGITTVDADGVALAAIQGLNQKLEQKDAEIAELRQRLEKLERLLAEK